MEKDPLPIEKYKEELRTSKNRAVILILSVLVFILFVFSISSGRSEKEAINELRKRNSEFIKEMERSEEIRDSLQDVIEIRLRNIASANKKLEDEKSKYIEIIENPNINDPDSLRSAILRAARQKSEVKKDGVLHSGRGK